MDLQSYDLPFKQTFFWLWLLVLLLGLAFVSGWAIGPRGNQDEAVVNAGGSNGSGGMLINIVSDAG